MIASIHKTVLLNETIEGLGLSRSQALGNSKPGFEEDCS